MGEVRREDYPVKKYTVNLFQGDLEALQELFPRAGASRVIRNLVRSFLNKLKSQSPTEPVELPDDILADE